MVLLAIEIVRGPQNMVLPTIEIDRGHQKMVLPTIEIKRGWLEMVLPTIGIDRSHLEMVLPTSEMDIGLLPMVCPTSTLMSSSVGKPVCPRQRFHRVHEDHMRQATTWVGGCLGCWWLGPAGAGGVGKPEKVVSKHHRFSNLFNPIWRTSPNLGL